MRLDLYADVRYICDARWCKGGRVDDHGGDRWRGGGAGGSPGSGLHKYVL